MAKNPEPTAQMSLPGTLIQRLSPSGSRKTGQRIPHLEILRALQDPGLGVANIAETYRRRVLPVKTRAIHLLGKKAPAQIIETLLGYEVKASFKRIQCPDMVTARYLKLFTELGCRTIRLPYDPTVTAALIPELEKSVARIESGVRELFAKDRQMQLYVVRQLYRRLRRQLKGDQAKIPAEGENPESQS